MAEFISGLKKAGESNFKEIYAKRAECDKNGRDLASAIDSKQATISDLATIRNNASSAKSQSQSNYTAINKLVDLVSTQDPNVLTTQAQNLVDAVNEVFSLTKAVQKQTNANDLSIISINASIGNIEDLTTGSDNLVLALNSLNQEIITVNQNLSDQLTSLDNSVAKKSGNNRYSGNNSFYDEGFSWEDGSSLYSAKVNTHGSFKFTYSAEDDQKVNTYTYTFPKKTGTVAFTSDLSSYVPTTRTINGKSLSSNITLTASDLGISTSSPVKIGSTLTISW